MPASPFDPWSAQLTDALVRLGVLDAPTAARVAAQLHALVEPTGEQDDPPPRPPLRVVRPGDDGPDAPEAHSPALRFPLPTRWPVLMPPLDVGHLRLAASPDVLQTIFQGRRAAAYRVHCDDGEALVLVDGEPALRLEPGQSADVEGSVIRARSANGLPARGRYARLPG